MSDLGRQIPKKWVVGERGSEKAERKWARRSGVTAAPFIESFHVLLPRRSERAVPESKVIGALDMYGS